MERRRLGLPFFLPYIGTASRCGRSVPTPQATSSVERTVIASLVIAYLRHFMASCVAALCSGAIDFLRIS
jgi:hypothetical protein